MTLIDEYIRKQSEEMQPKLTGIRDTNPVFDHLKAEGDVGIPAFVFEDAKGRRMMNPDCRHGIYYPAGEFSRGFFLLGSTGKFLLKDDVKYGILGE